MGSPGKEDYILSGMWDMNLLVEDFTGVYVRKYPGED